MSFLMLLDVPSRFSITSSESVEKYLLKLCHSEKNDTLKKKT